MFWGSVFGKKINIKQKSWFASQMCKKVCEHGKHCQNINSGHDFHHISVIDNVNQILRPYTVEDSLLPYVAAMVPAACCRYGL